MRYKLFMKIFIIIFAISTIALMILVLVTTINTMRIESEIIKLMGEYRNNMN